MQPATVFKECNLGNILLTNINYIPHTVLSFRMVDCNRHGYPECKWTPCPMAGHKDENRGSERSPSESQLHLGYEIRNSYYP